MSGMMPSMEQIDELHRRIAPSQAAYELIHTHCVIVARIAGQLARRQNELFAARHGLPAPDGPLIVPDGGVTGGVTAAGASAGSPESDGSPDTSLFPCGEPLIPSGEPVAGGRAPERLLDERLVVVGGLLHDIGTYRVLKHDGADGEPLKFSKKRYILHGLLGYEYLLDAGVDERIAQFARNHTGVGLTREAVAAQGLPLPPGDYMPVTPEQETVMVADKYHSKSVPPRFVSVDAYSERAARFGEDNRSRWLALVEQYGRPDIAALAAAYRMRMI